MTTREEEKEKLSKKQWISEFNVRLYLLRMSEATPERLTKMAAQTQAEQGQ